MRAQPGRGENVTLATESARVRTDSSTPDGDDPLLLARLRVGLWAVFVAIGAFTLADVKLARDAFHATMLVRLVQFTLIGAAAFGLRVQLRRPMRLASTVVFVSGIYLTSAVAGSLRGGASTQPITDLALAFATATTLPWGVWPQLVSIVFAALALVLNVVLVHGGFADVAPHMAAGLGVTLLVTVYIAYQLERYRLERDAAEAALRRNEQRFRALIERGRDVITIVDGEGVIRYDSPSVTRLCGHEPTARVGRRAAEFVHPDDLPRVGDAVAAAAGARVANVECRVACRDGSWCEVESVITDLRADAAVGGIVVNWRDIGERKRAEDERARYVAELAWARDQALASTQAKSMFLANMSHEIRTPMNVVIGLAEILLDSTLTAAQRADLGRLRDAAIGLLAIINDVLDTSKIEAGKMTVELVDVELRRTIEEAVGLLASAAAAKGLALGWTAAPGVPAHVQGDPVRLRQALVNLIGNAVKFTEVGSVAVEACVVQGAVRIAVTDSGIGVPVERQSAIFESFAQGDESTNRVYGGTGLGLSISRQLVTMMGGRMGVESAPGRGSTFWIELPMPRRSGAAAA